MIPLVTASEAGRAQAENRYGFGLVSCGLETFYQCEPGYKSLETGYHRG
jgi:hypothetical protein